MIGLNTSAQSMSQTQGQEVEMPHGARIMYRDGDTYYGDIDGDGNVDSWKGYFVPNSHRGFGSTFQMNGLDTNIMPSSFYTVDGQLISKGEKVNVRRGHRIDYKRNVGEWSLKAYRPSGNTRPDYIFVGISFYTQSAEEGHGQMYLLDDVI